MLKLLLFTETDICNARTNTSYYLQFVIYATNTVLNLDRYTSILAKISVFYLKRYDKFKILSDIILS